MTCCQRTTYCRVFLADKPADKPAALGYFDGTKAHRFQAAPAHGAIDARDGKRAKAQAKEQAKKAATMRERATLASVACVTWSSRPW